MRLLLLLLLAAPASANEYELPPLPIRVSLSGDAPICRSRELRGELAYRFQRVVDADQNADLRIACSETSENLFLDVYAGSRGITRLRVERSENPQDQKTAFLAARAAAKSDKVVAEALDAYVAHNAQMAAAGADDFASSNWTDSARELSEGLETELNAAPLYFGLYRAHAALNHPHKAKWYLMAFLRAQKRKPSDLTDEQARPLIECDASGQSDQADADALFSEYRGYVDQRKWQEALHKLKEIVAEAPWYLPAYVSLAQSYDGIGWKRLVKIWRARAVFVRSLNKDAGLGKDLEARLDQVR